MTVLRGYDGADPTFSLSAAKAHDGIVCAVYIVGSPGNMPHADKARVDAIRAAGMGALPNWERAADFFRTASLADCRNAGKEALAACRQLGFPDDGTVGVAFSFDYQVPASGFAHATGQLGACGDGMGGHYQPLGYAQIDLIEHWAGNGLPGPHWLMGSTWRATDVFTAAEVGSAAVGMVQSHDAGGQWLVSPVPGTDVNTVTQPDRLAAWWPDNSPYGGGMPLSKADVQAIVDGILGSDSIPSGDPANPMYTVRSILQQNHTRIADLTAAVADLTTGLDALKAQLAAGTLSVDQTIPATLHIGGTQ